MLALNGVGFFYAWVFCYSKAAFESVGFSGLGSGFKELVRAARERMT